MLTAMPEDFIIIGTDYGVGKTHVICALLRDLRRRGFKAMGYKPICCGDRADARAIREAAGEPTLSLELINPVYLRAQADPCMAAELQRVEIDVEQLIEGYRKLKETGYGPILIEGIGGVETPLAPGASMSMLARAFGLPTLVVAENKLGAAGLVFLAEKELEDCRGVILNHAGEEWDTAAVTNRQVIERFTTPPVLAEMIHGQDELDSEAVLGF